MEETAEDYARKRWPAAGEAISCNLVQSRATSSLHWERHRQRPASRLLHLRGQGAQQALPTLEVFVGTCGNSPLNAKGCQRP